MKIPFRSHLTFLLLFISIFAFAQNELITQKITVYKNGIYHAIKKGTLNFSAGKSSFPIYNDPLMGTYWVFSDQPFELLSTTDTIKINKDAGNFKMLIAHNINKTVIISYYNHHKEEISVKGKVLNYNTKTGLMKLELLNKNHSYFNLNEMAISNISFEGNDDIFTYPKDSTYKSMNVYSNQLKQDFELHYMAQGITWHPSYYLRLDSDKKAHFEMKGLIENFGEKIENALLELVVGPVSLFFGNQKDPIANNQLNTNWSTPVRKSFSYKAEASSMSMRTMDDSPQVNNVEGVVNHNLYHYELGKKNIPKNTKLNVPIFITEIDYIKEFHIHYQRIYFQKNTDYLQKNDAEVKSYLIFKNTAKHPISDGPLLIHNKNKSFVAQSSLEYTPKEGKVWVDMGTSEDFETSNEESVAKDNIEQKSFNRRTYYKSLINGEIILTNRSESEAKMVIHKTISGELIDFELGDKVNKTSNSGSPNPNTSVVISVKLKSGETKKINYQYETWILK